MHIYAHPYTVTQRGSGNPLSHEKLPCSGSSVGCLSHKMETAVVISKIQVLYLWMHLFLKALIFLCSLWLCGNSITCISMSWHDLKNVIKKLSREGLNPTLFQSAVCMSLFYCLYNKLQNFKAENKFDFSLSIWKLSISEYRPSENLTVS